MKNKIKSLFTRKSKWIDIGVCQYRGTTYLSQMRYNLSTNKKEFRKVKIGFLNNPIEKVFREIEKHGVKDEPDCNQCLQPKKHFEDKPIM